MERIDGNVEFQSISFSYPTRPQTKALNQLSFKAEAGEIVNLVGRSGSGKTTIANLLMKHYESSFGTVSLIEKSL
jgi:ATP-binding cassette subfamily B protein